MNNDFLIVAALKEESRGRFETLDQHLIYTGVGKLNAAIFLQKGLITLERAYAGRPKMIINLGTAVSRKYKVGEIVNVKRFIQRDMLCQPLAPKYYTPFDKEALPYIELSYSRYYFENVTCGTGDSFVSSCPIGLEYEIADMEGYALAKVCKILEIPFISIKYISDSGNHVEWEANLEKASIALTEVTQCLLKNIRKSPLNHLY